MTSPPTETRPDLADDNLVSSKSPRRVQEMFGTISPTYDLLNHLFSLNIDKRWRNFTARQALDKNVSDILDVCGGTGDMALALAAHAARLQGNPRIISSDFTPGMIKIGSRKFARYNGTSAPVPLVADTTCLPFADNSFDVVTVAFGIRNVVNAQQGLNEMARVCRPGGTVAVLEFSETRHPLINWAFQLYFRRILPAAGRLVTGTGAYGYLSKSVAKFPEGEAFCKMLTAATSGETRARRLSFGIATLYISSKKTADSDR